MIYPSVLLSLVLVSAEKPKNSAESLRALLRELQVGEGATVADVGAGGGGDTWTFADIVGPEGRVFSEEIDEKKVGTLRERAKSKSYTQVEAVLGRPDDPCLPERSADLIFVKRVYHHFAQPRPMLRGIWKSLRPGGYLVVVDQRRGTLNDWVPREKRAKSHHWIAETTVVREAREEGFTFVRCAEDLWHDSAPFVLVFRRPSGVEAPGADPDPFLPLDIDRAYQALRPLAQTYSRPVFVALGESRQLLPRLLRESTGEAVDVVLEEWATQKEERPPLPPGVSLDHTLTDKGDPGLGDEPRGVVFFLDTYHLLFHGKTLLRQLHGNLAGTGAVYVLDRRSATPLERREASHRRKIRPEDVVKEMEEAGFHLWFRGPEVAADRFLLVFGKSAARTVDSAADPFVAGPEIPDDPRRWWSDNRWRLRGLKTAAGRVQAVTSEQREADLRKAGEEEGEATGAKETFELPGTGWRLVLRRNRKSFEIVEFSGP